MVKLKTPALKTADIGKKYLEHTERKKERCIAVK